MKETLVVYHRCGGKSLRYPPNTILTAKWASDHGAKAIEYDVVLAQDGGSHKIIVIEPKVLKHAGLDIDNLQWKDAKDLNVGNDTFGFQKVPLLEEMINAIDSQKTGHQIHIKGRHPETVKVLLPKLKDLRNFLLTTFDISVIKEIKAADRAIPVGWLVKPKQEGGDEAGFDLTAKLVAEGGSVEMYSSSEITDIVATAKADLVDMILLCGPRIDSKEVVERVKQERFQVGTWGVANNLSLAKKLIDFHVDRFTLDNPEQLEYIN